VFHRRIQNCPSWTSAIPSISDLFKGDVGKQIPILPDLFGIDSRKLSASSLSEPELNRNSWAFKLEIPEKNRLLQKLGSISID
jgi:hypothetical protein